MKDLPDIALLASAEAVDAERLRAALEQTFTFSKTHALPSSVPAPLEAWEKPYVAREDGLPWPLLDDATKAAQAFLDPVLAAELDATWSPKGWRWESHDRYPQELRELLTWCAPRLEEVVDAVACARRGFKVRPRGDPGRVQHAVA